MNRTLGTILLTLLAASFLAVTMVAADAPPQDAAVATPPPAEREHPVPARVQELLDCVGAETAALADLNARFREATSTEEALAIQNEIARVKRETEIQLLRIQLRHARELNRDNQVREIEAALAGALEQYERDADDLPLSRD